MTYETVMLVAVSLFLSRTRPLTNLTNQEIPAQYLTVLVVYCTHLNIDIRVA